MAELTKAEYHRLVLEHETGRARVLGRVEATFDALRDDRELVHLLRVQAWARHDPSLVIKQVAGELRGAPDGWPPSVENPGEHVARAIVERRDAFIESNLGTTPTAEREPSVTPSVERFRQMIGGES